MHLSSILLIAGFTAARVLPRQEATKCTNPVKRVEFRTLDNVARKQYTDAVKCLTTKPSMLGLSTTLYDDFVYVHTQLNTEIHYVAQFLPWHRYFVHLYEKQLNGCGYTGPMVYWDWTLDVADVAGSDIWDAEHGFGGNGGNKTEKTADAHNREWKCLTDGPFKDIRPAYVLTEYAPHCLSRDFFDGTSRPGTMRSSAYTPEAIATINALDTFVEFEFELENRPHGSIHSAVGGKMGDMGPSSSPNEPLFFLHHAQVDRLWWLWQQGNPSVRNTEYAGKREITPGAGGRPLPPGEVAPVDPPAALTDVMPFMKLADDLPVSAIMTTENDLLCYTY